MALECKGWRGPFVHVEVAEGHADTFAGATLQQPLAVRIRGVADHGQGRLGANCATSVDPLLQAVGGGGAWACVIPVNWARINASPASSQDPGGETFINLVGKVTKLV
jgi:hypothetical protein